MEKGNGYLDIGNYDATTSATEISLLVEDESTTIIRVSVAKPDPTSAFAKPVIMVASHRRHVWLDMLGQPRSVLFKGKKHELEKLLVAVSTDKTVEDEAPLFSFYVRKDGLCWTRCVEYSTVKYCDPDEDSRKIEIASIMVSIRYSQDAVSHGSGGYVFEAFIRADDEPYDGLIALKGKENEEEQALADKFRKERAHWLQQQLPNLSEEEEKKEEAEEEEPIPNPQGLVPNPQGLVPIEEEPNNRKPQIHDRI